MDVGLHNLPIFLLVEAEVFYVKNIYCVFFLG